MTDKMKIDFPLRWPPGRPRLNGWERNDAKFREGRDRLTPERGADRLEHELTLIGATNPALTCDGWGRFKRGDDVAASVWFTLRKRPIVIACDRFTRLGDNIAAIAAHIEALRGQERWGCATQDEAFAGHLALPPSATSSRSWWDVLGVSPDATTEQIEQAHRDGLLRFHPDKAGGSHDAMSAINAARDAALSTRRR